MSADTSRIPDTTGPIPDRKDVMTALPEATEEEAYRQGWWAYSYGEDVDSDPYIVTEVQSEKWQEGWRDAQADDEG